MNEQLFYEKTGMSYSEAYNTYYDNLKYQLIKIKLSVQQAEDAAIQGLQTSFEKIERFDSSRACYNTWLSVITRRIGIGMYMHQGKLKEDSLYFNDGSSLPIEAVESDPQYIDEKAAIIWKYAEQLTNPIQKKTFYLRHRDELSYDEISKLLDLNINTIKSALRTARLKLRKMSEHDIQRGLYYDSFEN